LKKYSVVFIVIGLLALAGCGQSPDEPSNTHVFSGFRFSIDYPEDWLADTRATVTVISELEEDHDHAFRDDQFSPTGYEVTLDHRTMPFMRTIGLQENSTLDDLLEFNADTFDWKVSAVEDTQIFGVPALRAKVVDELGVASDSFMGFIGDEVFIFGLGAPSEDARDEFTSRWEEMLASIQPVEE
jgi:hypothetical protein